MRTAMHTDTNTHTNTHMHARTHARTHTHTKNNNNNKQTTKTTTKRNRTTGVHRPQFCVRKKLIEHIKYSQYFTLRWTCLSSYSPHGLWTDEDTSHHNVWAAVSGVGTQVKSTVSGVGTQVKFAARVVSYPNTVGRNHPPVLGSAELVR